MMRNDDDQERYPEGLVPTVISPHQWTMMVQQRLVDPEKPPLSQGWRVLDELALMPRGNIATRWAIPTSQVAGHLQEGDPDPAAHQPDDDGQVGATVNVSAAASASDARPVSATVDRGPQHGLVPGTKKWTEDEILHLVGLRAQRVPYQIIAADYLHRGVKSCQLKFDRIKRESPYREMLQVAGAESHRGSGLEDEMENVVECGSSVDDHDEDRGYDRTALEGSTVTDESQNLD